MIRYLIFSLFLFMLVQSKSADAQASSQVAFNQAANYFIDGQNQQALQTVNSALQKNPADPKLLALKKKLEEQQKQQQNQQNKQKEGDDKEKEDGEPKDSEDKGKEQEGKEKKEGNSEEKKDGKSEEKKEGEKKDEESENGEKKEKQAGQEGEENKNEGDPGSIDTEKRLQEMNISPEKARMILEAMKSNEVQYLQQKKRQQSRQSNDDGPDW